MDILFKPRRVEAAEQMKEKKDISQSKKSTRAQNIVCDMYVVVLTCFHSILRQKA